MAPTQLKVALVLVAAASFALRDTVHVAVHVAARLAACSVADRPAGHAAAHCAAAEVVVIRRELD